MGDDNDTYIIHNYTNSSDILDVLTRTNEGGAIERTALGWRVRWTDYLPYTEANHMGQAVCIAFVLAYYGPNIETNAISWKKTF